MPNLMIEDTDNTEREDELKTKCANCREDHPATERTCLERKRYQMIGREKDTGEAEGGITMRKKKGSRKKAEEQEKTGESGTEKGKESANKNNRMNGKTTNTTRNMTTNWFMALENLLNEQDNGPTSWADEDMEGQEQTDMGQGAHGNVPPA
ncbi:hypothetical protein C0993_010897 [Termitomyces sp. T159_Od127]|nr:hypothetical protein C0993_010897 [Termitomyces sp. T159_Od127]